MSTRKHLPLFVAPLSTTPLPPLLARWVDQALGPLPNETRATCDDCVMCRPDVAPQEQFLPGVRCCSFTPPLPNYAVGAILSGEGVTDRGRATVAERVASRLGATPLGLDPPQRYSVAYDAVASDEFGRRTDLLCPYLEADGAGCGIWSHRMSVCATWFCRHDRRALGFRAWSALKSFLRRIEQDVAAFCLLELDVDCTGLFPPDDKDRRAGRLLHTSLGGWTDPDGAIDDALARRVWGAWYGREAELYRSCATIAGSLEWPRIKEIGGVRLAQAEQAVRLAFSAARDAAIPSVLCVTHVDARALDDGRWCIQTDETPYDPLIVTAGVHAALDLFDGRPTEEAVRAAAAAGTALDDQMLRLLIEQGALAEPDGRDRVPRARARGPIDPDTRLCFFRGYRRAPVTSKLTVDDDGAPRLTVSCGLKEITFADPELIAFGEKLCAFQDGFRARDALAWRAGGYEWEQVRDLLETLVGENVLQVVPPNG